MNVDFMYPIGCLFITTDTSFNPNTMWGGTWIRLEGDVYLKNIPTNSSQPIGNYGGTSSDHKIPISSMPSHNHTGAISCYADGGGANVFNFNPANVTNNPNFSNSLNIGSTGGGKAYYPYYYGIICWHRTA